VLKAQYRILVGVSVTRVVLKYGSVLTHLNVYYHSALASPGICFLWVSLSEYRGSEAKYTDCCYFYTVWSALYALTPVIQKAL